MAMNIFVFFVLTVCFSIVFQLILLIFFKKDEVRYSDIFYNIPLKYGISWWARNPHVYFKENVAKFVNIPAYIFVMSFIILLFCGILR